MSGICRLQSLLLVGVRERGLSGCIGGLAVLKERTESVTGVLEQIEVLVVKISRGHSL